MSFPKPEPAALRSLKAGTAGLPAPWVSELVLQTNQYDLMKLFYEGLLGQDWFFENTPNPEVLVKNHHGDGGKQVHAKDVRAAFMRLPVVPPYGLTLAIFELTHLNPAPHLDPGLNHMQFKHADLKALVARIELLRDANIHPHRSSNHGPVTSFYYRDPDENIVELCIDNFATQEELTAFIRSDAFKANPSGIDLNRDEFLSRYHGGVPAKELLSF